MKLTVNHQRNLRNCLMLFFTFMTSVTMAQESVTEEQLRQAQQAGISDRVDLSQYIQSSGHSTGRNQPINLPSSSAVWRKLVSRWL
jgi:hypothetical protein